MEALRSVLFWSCVVMAVLNLVTVFFGARRYALNVVAALMVAWAAASLYQQDRARFWRERALFWMEVSGGIMLDVDQRTNPAAYDSVCVECADLGTRAAHAVHWREQARRDPHWAPPESDTALVVRTTGVYDDIRAEMRAWHSSTLEFGHLGYPHGYYAEGRGDTLILVRK